MADQADLYYMYLMNQMMNQVPPSNGIGPTGQPVPQRKKTPIAPTMPPVVDPGRMIGDPRDLGMNLRNNDPESFRMDPSIFGPTGEYPVQAKFTPPNLKKIGHSVGSVTSDDDRPSAYDEPLDMGWSQEYKDLYYTYPQRNKPTGWGRVRRGLAALDPRMSQEDLDRVSDPQFYRELEDWKNKQKALETPYTQERYERQNIRTARTAEDRNELVGRRLEETTRHNQEMEEIRRAANDKSGDWHAWVETTTGKLYLFNDKTHEMYDTGKRNLTPIELESIKAEQKTASDIAVAKLRGEIQKEIAGIPRTIKQDVTTTTTGGSNNQPSLGDIRQRADQLRNMNDLFRQWIYNDANGVNIAPVGTRAKTPNGDGFPLTQEWQNHIRDYIYNNKDIPPEIVNKISITTRGVTPPVSGTSRRIRVRIKNTGQTGTVLESEFDPATMDRIQ